MDGDGDGQRNTQPYILECTDESYHTLGKVVNTDAQRHQHTGSHQSVTGRNLRMVVLPDIVMGNNKIDEEETDHSQKKPRMC